MWFPCGRSPLLSLIVNLISLITSPFSNAYNLFHLSSFNTNGCKFPKSSFIWLDDKILSQDSSVTLPDCFKYCLLYCAANFCITQLNCCSCCGVKSHSLGIDKCSDCASSDHLFHSCPKLLRRLHESATSHHLLWKNIVREGIISCPSPHFKAKS